MKLRVFTKVPGNGSGTSKETDTLRLLILGGLGDRGKTQDETETALGLNALLVLLMSYEKFSHTFSS